ncbi:MAG TPA: CHAT domain-containing protein [Thermoanaerobaculia bacterium]|nr:CHAT domain-containing protein [Thermoanaerobaculia bacterium]
MTTHRVRGIEEPDAPSKLESLGADVRLKTAVRIDPVDRAGAPFTELPDVTDEDLVEVELDSGFVLWTRVDALREDSDRARTRSANDGTLPTHYPLAARERGVVGGAIRFLKFLDFDLPEQGARFFAERIERKLEGGGGLFRIGAGGQLSADTIVAGSEPVLLFLHGTASSTSGAFGALTQARSESSATGTDGEAARRPDADELFRHRAWRDLQARYGGRVYGFEHRTLTHSPVDNVVALLEALPGNGGPPLHVISHSRGGLVGELLGHGALGRQAFSDELLDAAGVRDSDRGSWDRLNELLRERAPRVERFVRVACPAGGTTLASKRLDVYFSILVHLLEGVPGVGPLLGGLAELAAAVAKERTDPKVLPGLEAQMPKSPFIRALNGSEQRLGTDLTVIAGDSDGFVKNLANLFYWRANDLVVDTRSMYGGAARERRLWYRAEGREVHHCNYFARSETVEKLVAGLTRADGDAPGFQTNVPPGAVRAHVEGASPKEGVDRTAVVLIPGVMGSHLTVVRGKKRNRIWVDVSDLMKGGMRKLAIGATDPVEADAVVPSAYDAFARFLRGHDLHVLPFPYDWRLSLLEAARRLADLLEQRLRASSRPIRIVAHSMGGLVARALIAEHPDLWQQVLAGGGRLVQVGTPNGGSGVIPAILCGQERMLKRLGALDLTLSRKELVALVGRFPGLLEMSPLQPESAGLDLFDPAAWQQLRALSVPTKASLVQARKTRDRLDAVELGAHTGNDRRVVYVAGCAASTAMVEGSGTKADPYRLGSSALGDGRVLWSSGIPANVPVFHIETKHGGLLDHRRSFDGLLDLIETGTTTRLGSGPPKPRAAPAERGAGELSDDEIEVFPSEELVLAAALGRDDEIEAERAEPTAEPRLEVRVVHGDLVYASHPVLVGHYAGDPIVSAEAVLDRHLDGELSYRAQLGTYPGRIGTAEVVIQAARKNARRPSAGPSGAVVIGLGRVGELTPGALTRSVEVGLVRLVQAHRACGEPASQLRVSSLLVGSGEAGLSLEQTLESILLGVRLVNRRLADLPRGKDESAAAIVGVDFVELYEDRALEALRHAERLSRQVFRELEVTLPLERSEGRRRRASYTPSEGWWTRLAIKTDELVEGRMRFTAHGGFARAAEEPVDLQLGLVERLLAESVSSSASGWAGLPRTLFELLVPKAFKGNASERRNLALVLDSGTAQYPWELLVDRLARHEQPIGVGAGLLRELIVPSPPPVAHAEVNRALVVGDPPSRLAELLGAQAEAKQVAATLAGRNWEVRRQIRKDPQSEKRPGEAEITAASVLEAVLCADYRIVHLAGHGVYDPGSPLRSGMVLGELDWRGGASARATGNDLGAREGERGESGKGHALLTPAEVSQMRLLPELVFVNCCHLGRIEATPPHRLAANLGTALITAGVKAAVVAGWAVEDNAAQTFARVFYEEMLAGRAFGIAVREARRATYEAHPETNTWAAYQCYGPPGFRLELQGSAGGSPTPFRYVDPCEIAVDLENLVGRARVEAAGGGSRVASELEALERVAAANDWANHPAVLRGLARAHGELGRFDEALAHYARARTVESDCLTIGDLQQRANFEARLGARLWKQASDRLAAAGASPAELQRAKRDMRAGRTRIDGAIRDAEQLRQLEETADGLAILASAYKRRTMTEPGDSEPSRQRLDKDLATMVEAYAIAAERDSEDRAYPLLNALLGVVLLSGPSKTAERDQPMLLGEPGFLEALETARADLARTEPRDFWQAIMPIDLALIESLADGKLAARSAELVASYTEVSRGRGSARELLSVADTFDFIESTVKRRHGNWRYGRPGHALASRTLLRAVRDLRKQLLAAA